MISRKHNSFCWGCKNRPNTSKWDHFEGSEIIWSYQQNNPYRQIRSYSWLWISTTWGFLLAIWLVFRRWSGSGWFWVPFSSGRKRTISPCRLETGCSCSRSIWWVSWSRLQGSRRGRETSAFWVTIPSSAWTLCAWPRASIPTWTCWQPTSESIWFVTAQSHPWCSGTKSPYIARQCLFYWQSPIWQPSSTHSTL